MVSFSRFQETFAIFFQNTLLPIRRLKIHVDDSDLQSNFKDFQLND